MPDTRQRTRPPVDRLAAAVAVAAALIVGIQLFVPPRLGLADNGDFKKVMEPAGIRALAASYGERYWNHFNSRYAFAPPAPASRFVSSEVIFARVARDAARAADRRATTFDIGWLGALHLAAFVLALGGLIAALRPLGDLARSAASVVALVFFTDAACTASFQSFYMQTASLLFLMLAFAAAAGIIARPGWPVLLPLYAAAAALFSASKTQEAVAGIALAALALPLASRALRRGAAAGGAAAAAAILAASVARYGAASVDRPAALYDVVFAEILPHSPDPAGDLAALGGDASLLRCSGTNAFSPGTCYGDAARAAGFFRRASFGRVVRLYVAHPSRALGLIARGGRRIFEPPENLGQFEKASGRPAKSRSRSWTAWSRARERATRGGRLAFVIVLAGSTAVAAVRGWRRAPPAGRRAREAILALVAVAAADFLVCVLADAHFELARHLYVVDACLDGMLAVDVVWIAWAAGNRRRSAPAG